MELYRSVILSHIAEYLKLKKYKYEARGKVLNLLCPFCDNPALTAQVVAQTHKIKCLNPDCPRNLKEDNKFTLLSIVKKIEKDKKDWENEKILKYLKDLLNISVLTPEDEAKINKWFKYYEQNEFSLTPVLRNDKKAIEKDWTNKTHYDIKEWLEWISTGLNVSLRTGEVSNITVIDFDQSPVPEELIKIAGQTLVQQTTRGFHYFYRYANWLPKTSIGEFTFIDANGKEVFIDNPNSKIKVGEENLEVRKLEIGQKGILKINNQDIEVTLKSYLKIDIENDKGLIVLFPSVVEGNSRNFINENPIIEMPAELQEYLKKKIKTFAKPTTLSETIRQEVEAESYRKPLIEEGEGRHDYIFRMGCVLRKQLSLSDTEFALGALNKVSCNPPLPYTEMRNIVNSISNYNLFDEKELANQILQHLKDVGEATTKDIERVIMGDTRLKAEEKQRLDKVIAYLKREDLIQQRGHTLFPLKKLDWETGLVDSLKPLNFKMPYFYDVNLFADGDMLILGGKNKTGKTHAALNIVKQLVEQGVNPYYISLETANRFKKISLQLGLKEGDFKHKFCYDPTKIELEDNAVTIIDWLLPSQYKDTDKIFGHFAQQLDKHHGILIIFVQLKEDGSFFASNLINFFPAMSARYFFDENSDGMSGYWEIDAVRERPSQKKVTKIPCKYDWMTKELKRVDEGVIDTTVAPEETILPDGKEEQ